MASRGYAAGHISLLRYVNDTQRAQVENETAALWGFPTPITQRNSSGHLIVAPRRDSYAVYSNIFDLDDPTLKDFAAFDFLSIPLRKAAWNVSVSQNRMVLTPPTRRLVGGGKVVLVLVPIVTSTIPWRQREAFIQAWSPLRPTDALLGHFVTVFAFDASLSRALDHADFAGAMALEDITDTEDGRRLLANERSAVGTAPTLGGYEYDPRNATHVAAAEARRDVSAFEPADPDLVNARNGSSFLYAFAAGWDSGAHGDGLAEVSDARFVELYRQASSAPGRVTRIAGTSIVGARVFALTTISSPAMMPPFHSTSTGVATIVLVTAFAVLATACVFMALRSMEQRKLEVARQTREQSRLLLTAQRAHDFTVSYMADSTRNPLHGLIGTLEHLVTSQASSAYTQEAAEDVRTVMECAQRLHRVLTDVAEFSLLSGGSMTVQLIAIPTRQLVLESLQHVRADTTVPVAYAVDEDVPAAFLSDRLRMLQLLEIGLSNAVRHNAGPPGEPVSMRVLCSNSPDSADGGEHSAVTFRLCNYSTGLRKGRAIQDPSDALFMPPAVYLSVATAHDEQQQAQTEEWGAEDGSGDTTAVNMGPADASGGGRTSSPAAWGAQRSRPTLSRLLRMVGPRGVLAAAPASAPRARRGSLSSAGASSYSDLAQARAGPAFAAKQPIRTRAAAGGWGLPLAAVIAPNISASVRVFDVRSMALADVARASTGALETAASAPAAPGDARIVTVFEVTLPVVEPPEDVDEEDGLPGHPPPDQRSYGRLMAMQLSRAFSMHASPAAAPAGPFRGVLVPSTDAEMAQRSPFGRKPSQPGPPHPPGSSLGSGSGSMSGAGSGSSSDGADPGLQRGLPGFAMRRTPLLQGLQPSLPHMLPPQLLLALPRTVAAKAAPDGVSAVTGSARAPVAPQPEQTGPSPAPVPAAGAAPSEEPCGLDTSSSKSQAGTPSSGNPLSPKMTNAAATAAAVVDAVVGVIEPRLSTASNGGGSDGAKEVPATPSAGPRGSLRNLGSDDGQSVASFGGGSTVSRSSESGSGSASAIASGVASPSTSKPQLGLSVLYADDEQTNRKLMTRLLAGLGCTVTAVSDGDEVEEAMEQHVASGGRPFDVVLLDIVMKRVGGDTVCRRLVHERRMRVPVIAVTGNARGNEAELSAAGFRVIVEKPFTAGKIAAALQEHVVAPRANKQEAVGRRNTGDVS